MYLIIKEIRGKNKNKQIPLRLYDDAHKAYNYLEQYIQESSGKHWHSKILSPQPLTKKFICKQRWYRQLSNDDIECLKIRYFKLY